MTKYRYRDPETNEHAHANAENFDELRKAIPSSVRVCDVEVFLTPEQGYQQVSRVPERWGGIKRHMHSGAGVAVR